MSAFAVGKFRIGLSTSVWVKPALNDKLCVSKGSSWAAIVNTRRLSATRLGLPPLIIVVLAMVPWAKSNILLFGLRVSGAPSCSIDGAPSSMVYELVRRSA